jgi:hypothetical protein
MATSTTSVTISPLFTLKNAEMGGGNALRTLLRKRRREGVSFRNIAIELSLTGVPVDKQTALNWCNAVDAVKGGDRWVYGGE